MQLVKQTIKISGMDCTACTLLVDGELEDLPGVKKSQTNYAKGQCQVEYDPTQITPTQILQAIQKTGYKISL